MIVIVRTIVLAAVVVSIAGSSNNAAPRHQLAEPFSAFGYHVAGFTVTPILLWIVLVSVGVLGLGLLVTGARRTVQRGRDARRELARSQRETSFINRGHIGLVEHEQHNGALARTSTTDGVSRKQPHTGGRARWSGRQPAATTSADPST
jgi:hypothetical protein